MNWQDAGLVAAGAAGGAAAMYLINELSGSGDDQPIILSGGSLHIEPRNRKFGIQDAHNVHHLDPNKKPTVSREVTDVAVIIPPNVYVRELLGDPLSVTITATPLDITLKWSSADKFMIGGKNISQYVDSTGDFIDIPKFSAQHIRAGKWLDQTLVSKPQWFLIIHYDGQVGS